MRNINDFLSYDTARYGDKNPHFDVRYVTEITQVEKNQFCLESEYSLSKKEDYPHWVLSIYVERYEKDIPEDEREWWREENSLSFHLTSETKPTIEDFSEHIFNEGQAILKVIAFGEDEPMYIWRLQQKLLFNRNELTPQQIFMYCNEVGYEYEKTKDFIYHYDFWESRLYHTIKFFRYLVEGANDYASMQFEYPIGEMLLHFLETGEYCDYEMVYE